MTEIVDEDGGGDHVMLTKGQLTSDLLEVRARTLREVIAHCNGQLRETMDALKSCPSQGKREEAGRG